MRTTEAIIEFFDNLSEQRKNEILNTPTLVKISGTSYFVSALGDDSNDGLSESTPWKTLDKVSSFCFSAGDGVFFKRGDVFRGHFNCKSDVTYSAYGEGDKPKFFGWEKDLANPELWECVYPENNIWKLKEKILDCGTLVFNHGESCSYKLIPSFYGGKFYCRENEEKEFNLKEEAVRDLDIYWHFDEVLTTARSEETCAIPVPQISDKSMGDLYLRCDKGNPGDVFSSIEAASARNLICVSPADNVTIDNLCIKYVGCHAISGGGHVKGLTVKNCEIGWIGGAIQCYYGDDPNYKLMNKRGRVTRFGNGVEIYGGCTDYEVSNCYFYEIYDAAMTHQITTCGNPVVMENITYKDNLVENAVYSIEYFLDTDERDTVSFMENINISGNILRKAGYGWGNHRPNKDTPAHIKGWNFINRAKNYTVENNIFDRSSHRLIHIVAESEESMPVMDNNTYIQNSGRLLGSFGTDGFGLDFFGEPSKQIINEKYGDKNAKVYNLE